MASFVQYVIAGLSSGAIYALIALGWALIFNVSGVLNLAQGEFLMLGGLVFGWLEIHTGLPLMANLALGVGTGIAAGTALDFLAIRRVRSATLVPLILVTLGASFVFREAARIGFGPNAIRHDYLVSGDPVMVFGAALLPETILTWGIVAVVVVLLGLFFRLTLYGKAMIACADDPAGAQAVGVNPSRMRTIAFAIAGALAGLGGVLIVSLTSMSWEGGTLIGLKGFIAAVFGGLGGYEGAVVGGLALGLLESLGAGYVSSSYKDVMALALLVVLLLVRPQGLLRGRVLAS
jgi:branched-subunit amino acid ABC-type transport system permease component